jgi:hypothetical protein
MFVATMTEWKAKSNLQELESAPRPKWKVMNAASVGFVLFADEKTMPHAPKDQWGVAGRRSVTYHKLVGGRLIDQCEVKTLP